jgi:hypothetical protein
LLNFRRLLLFFFGEASFEEFLLLLLPYLPVLLELDVLLDRPRPAEIEVPPPLLLKLLHNIALLHFELNALALDLLQLPLDFLVGLGNRDPVQNFDLINVVDPADDEMVEIPLEVEINFEFLLELIRKGAYSVEFELLVEHLLDKHVV